MKREEGKRLRIKIFLLVLCATSPFIAGAFTFTRDLRVGFVGQDVVELQKILNSNAITTLAVSGPGSPGQETPFFGILTKNAVVRFQELHKDEILKKAGLGFGTGYIGVLTRNFLNNINLSSVSKIPAPLSQAENYVTKIAPKVYSLSKYIVKSGSEVVITGENFLDKNDINFGKDFTMSGVSSSDGKNISVLVPDLSLGSYSVWVSNSNGSSKSDAIKILLQISNEEKSPPEITSVFPNPANLKSILKITGENFGESNNIYSNLGNIFNIRSDDGKTITVSVSQFPFAKNLIPTPTVQKFVFKLWIYVKSESGFNAKALQLDLEI